MKEREVRSCGCSGGVWSRGLLFLLQTSSLVFEFILYDMELELKLANRQDQ